MKNFKENVRVNTAFFSFLNHLLRYFNNNRCCGTKQNFFLKSLYLMTARNILQDSQNFSLVSGNFFFLLNFVSKLETLRKNSYKLFEDLICLHISTPEAQSKEDFLVLHLL